MNENEALATLITANPDVAGDMPEGGSITYVYPQSSLRWRHTFHGFWVWNAKGWPVRTLHVPFG
jgi:hypothetical protein